MVLCWVKDRKSRGSQTHAQYHRYENETVFSHFDFYYYFPLFFFLASEGDESSEQTTPNTTLMEKTEEVENGSSNNNNSLSQLDLTSALGKSITCKHDTQ